jgi:hypothetical protein
MALHKARRRARQANVGRDGGHGGLWYGKNMKFVTLFIGLQVIVISFLLRNLMKPDNYDSNLLLINNLRASACDSAAEIHSFEGPCHSFKKPSSLTCELCFASSFNPDIIVPAATYLGHFPQPSAVKLDEGFGGLDQFLQNFAYHFSEGGSVEVKVRPETFQELTKHFNKVKTDQVSRGNFVTMASRAAHEGCTAELAGLVDKLYLEKLPNGVSIKPTCISQPDLQLILEFNAGDRYGNSTAPSKGRMSVRNNNPALLSSSDTSGLMVIGGSHLQAQDNQIPGLLKELEDLKNLLHFYPKRTHLEVPDLSSDMIYTKLGHDLLKESDSVSLSAEVLVRLMNHMQDKLAKKKPTGTQLAVDALVSLIGTITAKDYRISRVHLHTSHLQVVCSTDRWTSPVIPAARAALAVAQLACNSTDIQGTEVYWESQKFTSNDSVIALDNLAPVQDWMIERMECAAALVPQCTKARPFSRESISSVGLANHLVS